jgi:hypothetical protein
MVKRREYLQRPRWTALDQLACSSRRTHARPADIKASMSYFFSPLPLMYSSFFSNADAAARSQAADLRYPASRCIWSGDKGRSARIMSLLFI